MGEWWTSTTAKPPDWKRLREQTAVLPEKLHRDYLAVAFVEGLRAGLQGRAGDAADLHAECVQDIRVAFSPAERRRAEWAEKELNDCEDQLNATIGDLVSARRERDRARTEAAQWHGSFDGMVWVERELKARVTQLEEALREIADGGPYFVTEGDEFLETDAAHIARAALRNHERDQ